MPLSVYEKMRNFGKIQRKYIFAMASCEYFRGNGKRNFGFPHFTPLSNYEIIYTKLSTRFSMILLWPRISDDQK